MTTGSDAARATAEAAARQNYGRLVAYLAARTRDVAGAEDALADAFAEALARWPQTGVPDKPEAWLLAVARRRGIDAVRRGQTRKNARDHLAMIDDERAAQAEDEELPDERLRLMFACAHPAIDASVRAPLILQTVLGFDAAAIASAFLVAPATMGQRLVRAKTRIRDAGIPFRIPERSELAERLDAVLSAIYAAFAEGWTDAIGGEGRRRNLAGEAIWLGRLMVLLLPDEPETFGLLALMLYAEGRRRARRNTACDYVPLSEQDFSLWDAALIDEAEGLLRRASSFGATGRYQLEAAVQSAHTARRHDGSVNWAAIKALYDVLTQLSASPVVCVNRAVAIAETSGAQAGLTALDTLTADQRLDGYQPYWAVRAEILARLGLGADAAAAYDRAIGLETDDAVRRFLAGRKARLAN